MRLNIYTVLISLAAFFSAPSAYPVQDNPEACNCETVDVSVEESAAGCPAGVKEKTCSLYRETRVWKERLRQQQEQRRLEKRMEPRTVPH